MEDIYVTLTEKVFEERSRQKYRKNVEKSRPWWQRSTVLRLNPQTYTISRAHHKKLIRSSAEIVYKGLGGNFPLSHIMLLRMNLYPIYNFNLELFLIHIRSTKYSAFQWRADSKKSRNGGEVSESF